MTDLSDPPFSARPPEAPGAEVFAWPVPDARLYPPPQRLRAPLACVVETLDQRQHHGLLMALNPSAGVVLLRPAGSHAAATRLLKLRFDQFRRLSLQAPLHSLADAAAPSSGQRRWRLQLLDGQRVPLSGLPPLQLDYGVFGFMPVDDSGSVLRSFYPLARLLPADRRDARDVGASALHAAADDDDDGQTDFMPTQVDEADALLGLDEAPAAAACDQAGANTANPLPDLLLDDSPAEPSESQVAARPAALSNTSPATRLPPKPAAGTTAPPAAGPVPGPVKRAASGAAADAPIDSAEPLWRALAQQQRLPLMRIGEALLAMGAVDERQLGDALQAQAQDRSLPLGELLVRQGRISRAQLQGALMRKMGYPMVDAAAFTLQPEAVLRLPAALAQRLVALPLLLQGGQLVVALEDPSARQAIDEIEFATQAKVLPVLAAAGSLAPVIEQAYLRLGQDGTLPMRTDAAVASPGHATPAEAYTGNRTGSHSRPFTGDDTDALPAFGRPDTGPDDGIAPAWPGGAPQAGPWDANRLLANLESQPPGGAQADADDGPPLEQSDNSLVRLINSMILQARAQGVSDIHIECPPGPSKVRIRFRRDGQLKPYLELPHRYRQALVARLKIMCDLDIAERRKPQDGKISFGRWMQGQTLELRVATIPTVGGLEDVVLRLLSGARALPLHAAGLLPDTLAQLRQAIAKPYGLVLCVGPTGSGKTTTLHAALRELNTPQRKIWTAEDPVEITQAGLRQVQVNPKIDWTFAKALRAFLRADPDVVMVGEIRDRETAQIAVEASLTGHLVLSTLHTNSAAETITRLLDLGSDPFSLADSLLAVLAQRLVRRWCPHCVQASPAGADHLDELLHLHLQAWGDAAQRPDADSVLAGWRSAWGSSAHGGALLQHHAGGCPRCDGSGYLGRLALHELMPVTRPLRRLIQSQASAEALLSQAQADGLRTLRQDGLVKVLQGLTALDEVRACANG